MKLKAAVLLSFAALALAACGTSGRGETIELPGGVLPEEERDMREPGFLDRLVGNDDRPNVGPCPLMGVLYDSSRLVDFAAPDNQRYANIEYTGELQGVRGLCRYVGDDPITMNLEIDMAFGRGPAATGDRQTYRYWVAVTRRGRAPIEKVERLGLAKLTCRTLAICSSVSQYRSLMLSLLAEPESHRRQPINGS